MAFRRGNLIKNKYKNIQKNVIHKSYDQFLTEQNILIHQGEIF